jgi:hypothetical protein
MIKKDYVLIADLLAKNNANNNLIIAITDAFKKDNKRFNSTIFIKHIEKKKKLYEQVEEVIAIPKNHLT